MKDFGDLDPSTLSEQKVNSDRPTKVSPVQRDITRAITLADNVADKERMSFRKKAGSVNNDELSNHWQYVKRYRNGHQTEGLEDLIVESFVSYSLEILALLRMFKKASLWIETVLISINNELSFAYGQFPSIFLLVFELQTRQFIVLGIRSETDLIWHIVDYK